LMFIFLTKIPPFIYDMTVRHIRKKILLIVAVNAIIQRKHLLFVQEQRPIS
jgi:hypothetical protein